MLLNLFVLQLYSIRDAAANNLKCLAEEFGPEWAMQHIVPQVFFIWLWSDLACEKTDPSPKHQYIILTFANYNYRTTTAHLSHLTQEHNHIQYTNIHTSCDSVHKILNIVSIFASSDWMMIFMNRYWRWLATHTTCIGWQSSGQFLCLPQLWDLTSPVLNSCLP